MFLTGQGVYEEVWDYDEDLSVFVLKKLLTRSKSDVHQDHVNKEILERKFFNTTEMINGRILIDQAKLAAKNMRKAYSIIKPLLNQAGYPKDSGNASMEKVVNAVLNEMWNLLNTSSTKDNSNDKVDVQVNECDEDLEDAEIALENAENGIESEVETCSKRPADCFFSGWMAFIYFGPLGDNIIAKRNVDLLRLTDPPKSESKNYGRSKAREAKTKVDSFARSRDDNRGNSVMENVLLQTVQFNCNFERKSMYEVKLFSLNVRADRTLKQMSLAFEQGKAVNTFEAYNKLQEKLHEINSEIESIEAEMMECPTSSTNDDMNSFSTDALSPSTNSVLLSPRTGSKRPRENDNATNALSPSTNGKVHSPSTGSNHPRDDDSDDE